MKQKKTSRFRKAVYIFKTTKYSLTFPFGGMFFGNNCMFNDHHCKTKIGTND